MLRFLSLVCTSDASIPTGNIANSVAYSSSVHFVRTKDTNLQQVNALILASIVKTRL